MLWTDLTMLLTFIAFLMGWVAGLYTYDHVYRSVWRSGDELRRAKEGNNANDSI